MIDSGPFTSVDPNDVQVSTYLSELVYRAADASRAGGRLDSKSFTAAEASLQSLFPSLQLAVSVHTAGPQRYLVGESHSAVYVAFQGTHHPNDWLSNLRYTHTPFWQATNASAAAHKGFVARSQSVPMEQLHARAQASNKRLVLCGHSLGGAVAMLGLLRLLGHSANSPSASSSASASPLAASAPPMAGAASLLGGSGTGAGLFQGRKLGSSRGGGVSAAGDPRVRCICFATPAFANEALARHVAEAGLDQYICNFVIPEDPVVPFINQLLRAGSHMAGTQVPSPHPSTPRPDSPLAMGATALTTDDASDTADDDSSDAASSTSSSASSNMFASVMMAGQQRRQHGQHKQQRRRRHSSAMLRTSDSASSLNLWDAFPSIKQQKDHMGHMADASHGGSIFDSGSDSQWGAVTAVAAVGGAHSGRRRRASTGSKTMIMLPLASMLLPPLRQTAVGLVQHRTGMLSSARLLLAQLAAGLRTMALAARLPVRFRVLSPMLGRMPLGFGAAPTAVAMLHLIGAFMAASVPQSFYIGQQYVMTASGAEPVMGPLSQYPKSPESLRLHELNGFFKSHRMISYRNRVLQVFSAAAPGQGLAGEGPVFAS